MIGGFVVQEHATGQGRHWDLMLERAGVLATWQLCCGPWDWGADVSDCRRIFDHRLKYLSYEGALSDDRGRVHIVASGSYEALEIGDECWRVVLRGESLSGYLELRHLSDDQWRLKFEGES